MSLIDKDKAHVWHPFTQHFDAQDPLEIIKGEGVYLIDSDGKKYIDANSSWWVNTHGHGHPHIRKAIDGQFSQLDHVVFAGVTHPKAVELADRITSILPDPLEKVFFSDNGSTAVEIGLKMIFQYWYNKGEEKKRILAMHGSYHGDTFGAMSVGQRGYFNTPFEPFFFDVDYIDFPDNNEEEILNRAKTLFATDEFAGMIVEPLVEGAAGMKMYSPEFLDKLTTLARENNVLVLFDEVMTGFGRTGKMFAMDHCKNPPDIATFSKGLTAGVMALGLTVATNDIFNSFLSKDISKALLHGHSFTANPIACAVACASLDLFEESSTWARIAEIEQWNNAFAIQLSKLNFIENTRIQGTIIAFEVNTGEGSTYFSDLKTIAYKHFLAKGILLRPLGNTLFINAPFCIEKSHYDHICDSVLNFLNTLKK
jgi:adenosylmethionine-8-amino-7-oxononanoate aminotransferase